MSNIVKVGIQSPVTTGSFKDIITRRQKTQQAALLLDVSGSMCASSYKGGTRIEALRVIANDFPATRQFEFSHSCKELFGRPPSHPGGGTYLAKAFFVLKSAGVKHVVLVTDGEPTEPDGDVLNAAIGLKVDIFYVGGDAQPPQILVDLANGCGGKFDSADIVEDHLAISEKIRGLLA